MMAFLIYFLNKIKKIIKVKFFKIKIKAKIFLKYPKKRNLDKLFSQGIYKTF
jgi:hypothetical protein